MAKRREKLKVSKRGGKRWSARMTRESDALTLEKGVFPMPNARKIALSLKRSADRSRRRKAKSPLGNVDAHLLYQPGRQRSFQEPQSRNWKRPRTNCASSTAIRTAEITD
jgi:hypothetical protein